VIHGAPSLAFFVLFLITETANEFEDFSISEVPSTLFEWVTNSSLEQIVPRVFLVRGSAGAPFG
jgi:hypothetical protein